MLKVLFVTGLLLSAVPAVAQTQAPAAAPAANASKDDPNKLICKTERQIGSRLASKRTCMTAAEWQAQQERNQRDLQDWNRQMQGQPQSG